MLKIVKYADNQVRLTFIPVAYSCGKIFALFQMGIADIGRDSFIPFLTFF